MGKNLAEPASSLPIPVSRRIQEPPAILARPPATPGWVCDATLALCGFKISTEHCPACYRSVELHKRKTK